MIVFIKKVWGFEYVIRNDKSYCMKELHLKALHQCSLHHHVIKTETFYISEGIIELDIEKVGEKGIYIETTRMGKGNYYHINPGVNHRFRGITDAVIIECSTQHFEEDSYRKEDSKVVHL